MIKTNVMRLLDGQKLPYTAYEYTADSVPSGLEVARMLGQDPNHVFKTLVTVASSRKNYVFVIPVGEELSLKKAANAVNEKSIEMLKSKDLLPLTGYIHGGCSPIGMKKQFFTVVDSSAKELDKFYISGGRVGVQIRLSPAELVASIRGAFESICM